MAKHIGEVDTDIARHAASQPKWTSRAKLSRRRTKTGRRCARLVESGEVLGTKTPRWDLGVVRPQAPCDLPASRVGIFFVIVGKTLSRYARLLKYLLLGLYVFGDFGERGVWGFATLGSVSNSLPSPPLLVVAAV
eukprot:5237110-Amphidinium_carterae.1